MKKFRSFITVLFLLAAVVVILLVALADHNLLVRVVDLVKNYLWIAGIVLLLFLILFSAGIVSNLHNSEGSLISNGYFQTAILLLFLISGGLGYCWYYVQQPGQIVLQINPKDGKDYISIGLTFQSAQMDTVTAPGELDNRPAGKYRIETLDTDIENFQTDIILKPMGCETVVIPVVQNFKTLTVRTDPANAEIWIDSLHTANSPYTFEISNRDTVILELKLEGYQTYVDTVTLSENVDLGTVELVKLYRVRILCAYPDFQYMIYDAGSKLVFTARESRTVNLPRGNYKVAYEIGEGQFETKTFSVNKNSTLSVP